MVIWIKNSRGRPDALLTFAALGVVAVLGKVLLNGASFRGFSFGTIDASLATGTIGVLVGAYTAKRVAGGKPDHGESKP